ncbi:hypothetical protein ATCC90586_000244 [Pythium insidiosum]|nr:hypothetical protein ATCC90586_000244 [Pythium insidiosum]
MAPSTGSSGAWFTLEDAKAAFNLFCCVYGIGTLGMPANFARAGPVFAMLALAFMAFANVFASVAVSKVMLAAPATVRTYGDLGEWVLGPRGRYIVVASQMGVCLLVPCAFLVLGGIILQVLFPHAFGSSFWIVFMALTVFPVCLVPTLKEGAGMALAGCLGTILSDGIALGVLLHEMHGHPAPPAPKVSMHQVLTTFGNLSLAYGAAIVIPDLQRQHSDPTRMPRVVFVTLSFISVLFLVLAGSGYSAAGCQISGNLLFTIAVPSGSSTGDGATSPLGFHAHRGAVIMAYLFMQLHITIAFAVILHPAFFIAERLVLGMHEGNPSYHDLEDDDDENGSDVQRHKAKVRPQQEGHASNPNPNPRTDSDTSLEGDERSDYKGPRNVVRYVALRTAMVTLLVLLALVLQDSFLELVDFIGASAISINCLIVPMALYLKVLGPQLPRYERWAALAVGGICSLAAIYVVLSITIDFFRRLGRAGADAEPLRSRWSLPADSSVDARAFAVDLNKSIAYNWQDTTIDVRAIAVGNKLYVHFVDSSDQAMRVDLVTDEYVHPHAETALHTDAKTLVVERWDVNVELLRWRLERVVFPLFEDSSALPQNRQAAADAELGRLPEALVETLSSFLTAVEFSHVTQTNQYLHKMEAREEVWTRFLRRGAAIPSPGAREKYIAKHCDLSAHRRAIQDNVPFFQFLPSGPPVLPHIPDLFPPPQRGPWLPRTPGLGSNLPPFMRSGYDDDRFPP